MKNFQMTVTVSANTLCRIHDAIYGVFAISLSQEQLEHLIKKSNAEINMDAEDFIDDLVYALVKMKVPMYGSSEEYKESFWHLIEEKKEEFIKWCSE